MSDQSDDRKNPNRRVTDRGEGPPTVIAPGASFRGDVVAPGSVMLSGTIRGDGDIGTMLSIARDALWEGRVRCGAAVIAGSMVGTLEVSGALEVGHTARVKGQISARTLAIASGAVIEGDIQVTSGADIVRFEERRTAK